MFLLIPIPTNLYNYIFYINPAKPTLAAAVGNCSNLSAPGQGQIIVLGELKGTRGIVCQESSGSSDVGLLLWMLGSLGSGAPAARSVCGAERGLLFVPDVCVRVVLVRVFDDEVLVHVVVLVRDVLLVRKVLVRDYVLGHDVGRKCVLSDSP